MHAEDRGGPARYPAEQAGAGAAAGRGQVSCDWSAGGNTILVSDWWKAAGTNL